MTAGKNGSQPFAAERLDPDGPRCACTSLRSRKYGPPIDTDGRACKRDATWLVYDAEHGWFLCDVHAEIWGVAA